MKRCVSTGSCNPETKEGEHKIEYDVHWKDVFPWHIPVYAEEGNSKSEVVGLPCSLCKRHGTTQNGPSLGGLMLHVPPLYKFF